MENRTRFDATPKTKFLYFETAQRVFDDWWGLADYLIVKYNDGYVNVPEGRSAPGYTKEWLDAVGYGKTKIKNK